MYLLTFATLLIAIIGIYTEAIGVQTARMAAQQQGIASALFIWQSAAVSMAQSVIKAGGFTPASSPCSLTYKFTSATTPSIPNCPAPVAADTHGTVTDGSAVPQPYFIKNPVTSKNICVNLPSRCTAPTSYDSQTMDCTACTADYDTVNYQFRSILYNQGNQNYVVTFIPPAVPSATNPGAGVITAYPSGTPLSMSIADVMRQLRNAAPTNYSYGYIVSNGTTTTVNVGGTCNGAPCVYTLPSATFNTLKINGLSLNGGVAIIGTP